MGKAEVDGLMFWLGLALGLVLGLLLAAAGLAVWLAQRATRDGTWLPD